MKPVKLVAAAVLALASGEAHAFHTGGVGACEGCHTMHSKPDATQSGPYLLLGTDDGSTCLTCHGGTTPGGYQVLSASLTPGLPPGNYTPGGDFAWLMKSFSWVDSQGVETSPGENHGHNVIATDFGLVADYTRTTAPGGSYPSNKLSCTSCHDPHGKYRLNADGSVSTQGKPIFGSGSYGGTQFLQPTATASVGVYRLLGGVGYVTKSTSTLIPFWANAPVALSPPTYNQSERLTQVRVAYGVGMSEWCQNCHGAIHTPSETNTTSKLMHPAGSTAKLTMGGENYIYNNYVSTGVLTGSQLTSYTSMVPYEEGIADRTSLSTDATSDGTATGGPTTGQENVMCLSCHRAHASGWDFNMRWNMPPNSTIVFGGAWPGIDATGNAGLPANAQGRTKAETRGAMYDRDPSIYSPFQRVLCNKCHGQD